MHPRFIERRIREALTDTPVFAINGPRQAGKTTLAQFIASEGREYITLDDASALHAARSDPTGFVRRLDRAIIDEVQRAQEVLLALKRSIDDDGRPGRFLITSSANILTMRTARESLAGRMEVFTLLPLALIGFMLALWKGPRLIALPGIPAVLYASILAISHFQAAPVSQFDRDLLPGTGIPPKVMPYVESIANLPW